MLGTLTIPIPMQALGNDISNAFGLVFFFNQPRWHLHAMIKINDRYAAEYAIIFLISHQSESLKNNKISKITPKPFIFSRPDLSLKLKSPFSTKFYLDQPPTF